MLTEKTILFDKLVAPDGVSQEVKESIEATKSVTMYYEAITLISEFKGYTEVQFLNPFTPFAKIDNPEVTAICTTLARSQIVGMIEKREAIFRAGIDEEEKSKMASIEKRLKMQTAASKEIALNNGKAKKDSKILTPGGFTNH